MGICFVCFCLFFCLFFFGGGYRSSLICRPKTGTRASLSSFPSAVFLLFVGNYPVIVGENFNNWEKSIIELLAATNLQEGQISGRSGRFLSVLLPLHKICSTGGHPGRGQGYIESKSTQNDRPDHIETLRKLKMKMYRNYLNKNPILLRLSHHQKPVCSQYDSYEQHMSFVNLFDFNVNR